MAATDEQSEFFEPEWFKNEGIQGFEIDPEIMDFETDSMRRVERNLIDEGYDPKTYNPIILARSKNPKLQGKVINGKHRLVLFERLRKKGIFKIPKPLIVGYIDVTDEGDFEIHRIHYEKEHLLHKDPKVAMRSIVKSLKKILKQKPELLEQKKMEHFIIEKELSGDMGFIMSYHHDIEQSEQKKRQKQESKDGQKNDWPEKKKDDNQKTLTEMGHTTSYLACPCCKSDLAILVDDETKKVTDMKSVKELTTP